MNIKIKEWYSRLGNNIIQVKNTIQISLFYGYNVILPQHNYFNTQYIKINENINENDSIIIEENFFDMEPLNHLDKDLFNKNIEETIRILKDIFKIKNCIPLNENDVVIHIRSGDIFSKRSHRYYIPPPLAFFTNILNNNKFDNIILIAEDNKNPCINHLLKLYPHIKFTIQSLESDINLLLGSFNVIESFGTFTPSLLILSNHIKNIYRPSYQCQLFDYKILNVNVYETSLNEYQKIQTPWQNKIKQHALMLTYKV